MPTFSLDPRLDSDTFAVGDLPLSTVRLMNDSRFPWLLLVPRRAGASELTDLDEADAQALTHETRLAMGVLQTLFGPDKMNVAALGNQVAQLHVHVIARFHSDPAWPNPIWGRGEAQPYPDHAAAALVERAGALFAAA